MAKLKLVYVEWNDACHLDGGWRPHDQIETMRPAHMMSVGWVLGESKTHVTLVAHGSNDTEVPVDVQGNICIPRGCITRMKRLKIP